MTLIRRLIYFSAAFTLVAGALLAFFHQAGLFEVKKIPVEMVQEEGGTELPGSSVVGLKDRLKSSLKKHSGKKIWEIDLDDVRASLIKDEWVSDVLISRSLPNLIHVRVKPKTAIVVLVSQDGQFLPVTEDGSLLKPLPAGIAPDVPILRGLIFLNDRARRKEAVKFASALAQSGPLSSPNISEITWSDSEGYSLMLIQPKIEVKLGEDRIDMKVLRVTQVLNYLSTNNLKGRVIDASFSKKVLVRLRKGS